MKYFVGFVLALSVLVNIIYMHAYTRYSIVIDNGWDQHYTITFDSYTEPVLGGDARTESIDGTIVTYTDYAFFNNDSIHPLYFYYKTDLK